MAQNKGKANDKITKIANDRSTMSLNASLEYWKEKVEKNEDEYKGKVIFSISEKEANGSYKSGKAFLDKAKAKLLAYSILNHQFKQVYGEKMQEFGGSIVDGKPEARVLTVALGKSAKGEDQYQFKIDIGDGVKGDKGQFKMAGRARISVSKYVKYNEGLIVAHELYDYIRDAEAKGMNEGKALCTKSYFSANASPESEFEDSGEHEEASKAQPAAAEAEYVMPFGNRKGTPLSQFSDDNLTAIIEKCQDENDMQRELKRHAQLVLDARNSAKEAM